MHDKAYHFTAGKNEKILYSSFILIQLESNSRSKFQPIESAFMQELILK